MWSGPPSLVRILCRCSTLTCTPVAAELCSRLHVGSIAQRQETIMNNPEVHDFDYIKEEIGYRVSDRVLDIKRQMDVAVDIGSGRGYVTQNLSSHSVKKLYALEMSPGMLNNCVLPPSEENIECHKILINEDDADLPFEDESVDIVTSSLSMHWVNNLPGLFKEVNRVLKKDGVFIGAMFGGETLFELRCSLQLAELERDGGIASHISPFVEVQDLGNLLNRCKFSMLTIDSDEIKVAFPTIFELMRDLKGMAESNASWTRKLHLKRDTLISTSAIYKELYGNEDDTIPATFQIFYWIGWKPDASQPQALKPQKSDISLKDLHNLEDAIQKHGVDEPPKKQ
eukprot:maker-scaffold5_size1054832-snap-gene-9.23 protein:Tk04066 transcript:maker-scaffold5_size1054832-snap-gene-9.23-mRNA-1 annotation:"methyltransferase c20orf7-like mitochondrial"